MAVVGSPSKLVRGRCREESLSRVVELSRLPLAALPLPVTTAGSLELLRAIGGTIAVLPGLLAVGSAGGPSTGSVSKCIDIALVLDVGAVVILPSNAIS